MLRAYLLACCLLLGLTHTVHAQRKGDLFIRNGTVLTVTNGTLPNTDILIRNGKIAAIGQHLEVPDGIEVIDATGLYVMPGIIDAHAHIAISNVNEATNPVTAEVSVGDVLNPYDIRIYRALAGGVTVSHVMHGSANVIGGQNETIKHRYGETDPDALRMEGAPRTIKFALGENPIRVHGRGHNVTPLSRMGVEFVIRDAFHKAQRYMEAWERYERERKRNPRAVPPPYNERLEVLADILRGNILIHCHSYRADEILMLLRVLKDFGIRRVVFQHANEAFKVAPELAAFGAMVSVFADWWAYKFEVYYSTAYNAAILTRNGVITSINSDSPELNRHLYHEAAKAIKYGGLTEDEALALITINPARQLGIEDRVGSIEVGKDADLAIFSAHPLSIYAVCKKTIVDGIVRFDADRDPDDMRLRVDPERPVELAIRWGDHQHHQRCLEGVDLIAFLTQTLQSVQQ
ncbi:MAG: amidohydrolase [Rhodothermus sp.]|nr:amidohydrolase [Rhodothermus sp.]